MKWENAILFVLLLLFIIPTHDVSAEGKKLYTTYNLWYERPGEMWFVNYKQGEMIPAGTEVRDTKIIDVKEEWDRQPDLKVIFTTASDGKNFIVTFKDAWHPGKTIETSLKAMFSGKKFDELTAGLTDKEIYAIRRGFLVAGMSKPAVLVAYGIPPEHHTPDLELNSWSYWVTKTGRKEIYFDEDGLTLDVL